MTLGERLKKLRNGLGLSQEAMGAQGFVSAPGWIKIENGQRLPSDELLHRLISWMLKDQYITVQAAGELLEELLTLKYIASPSAFVRKLAHRHSRRLSPDTSILVAEDPGGYHVTPRRKRPAR